MQPHPLRSQGVSTSVLNGLALASAMEYQVILERDADAKRYTASVSGLPIIVDAKTKREALKLAKEAITLYAEETNVKSAPAIHAELVTVNV
jgi:predicted RNase H-like HicB family nuclease